MTITKRICVTPAGRKRYLEILVKYMAREHEAGNFDQWHLWQNTDNENNVEYMKAIAEIYPWIKLVEPKMKFSGNISIAPFFQDCTDPAAAYIRLDDDIVFIEKDAIKKLFDFRIANPKYFLVYGNIVNNAVCNYFQGVYNAAVPLALFGEITNDCMCPISWGNPQFARLVHIFFLKSLENDKLDFFRFGQVNFILNERFSINVISWLGSEFMKFGGTLPVPCDEEEWLSVVLPDKYAKTNCIYGEALFVHYAFYPQRDYLDNHTNILERYKNLAEEECK